MSNAGDLARELRTIADPKRAANLARFFKTGAGEYGEGDLFLGIKVPDIRRVAKQFRDLSFSEILFLLKSKFHEERFAAFEVLVMKRERGDEKEKARVTAFYLKNTKRANNWDLVDTSAPYILGEYLVTRDRSALYRLAKSKNLWERRIAIVSTFAFIRRGELADTFALAELLMADQHDLIHKAVGWALREAGKKDVSKLETFLEKHAKRMPRTMLRYAIEKFPKTRRQAYLRMKT